MGPHNNWKFWFHTSTRQQIENVLLIEYVYTCSQKVTYAHCLYFVGYIFICMYYQLMMKSVGGVGSMGKS